jgi:hypothetical protein
MTLECLPNQKETIQKYRKVTRIDQARMILAVQSGQTQEFVAEQNNVPRTTLEHWIKRMKELENRHDPEVTRFLESPAGLAFLHRLLIAALLIFHTDGGCGLPSIHKFLKISTISNYVGASLGTLHKVSCQIDRLLKEFGESERERLGALMPHRKITGCGDETFFDGEMLIVFMEAVSGFILAEQKEEKRDAETWEKVMRSALKGLNVDLIQVTGDEAGGLTSAVTNLLGIHKSSDLFHIQQDITKGLTSHLARRKKRAEEALQESKEAKEKSWAELRQHFEKGESTKEDPKAVKVGKKMLKACEQEEACQKHLEIVKGEQKMAQEARRAITEHYHPFDLETGAKRKPENLKKELSEAYDELELVAEQAKCTDNQKKKLKKSKGMVDSLAGTLSFFWLCVMQCFFSLRLDNEERVLFEEFLLPIAYLEMIEGRGGKREREQAGCTVKALKEAMRQRDGPLPDEQRLKELKRGACEYAELFQRSSSCVEGHNGALSLKYHASRHLNCERLNSRVVLHNYFNKRRNGTTAAERFFQEEPKDVFSWLLERVSWPVRPRNKRDRLRVKTCQEARNISDSEIAV